MQDCKDYIQQVYLHPQVVKLIEKIEPKELRDDLHQEMAITLLEYECEKIEQIWADGKLLNFACSIICNMAFSNTSQFYKKYRKSELKKAIEYIYLTAQGITPSADPAKQILEAKKLGNIYQNHDYLIFSTYIELGSMAKVSRHYNIPLQHTKEVISKVRKELKTAIRCSN